MEKWWLIVLSVCCFALPACSWLAPNYSKAVTEEYQLEQMEKQTALMEQQTADLSRIADAIEKIANLPR